MSMMLRLLLKKIMENQQSKNQVIVYIDEDDAKKWLLFQEYYDPISILISKNVFEQKNCAVSLHFDNNGILQTIQRADFLFSRRHEPLSP